MFTIQSSPSSRPIWHIVTDWNTNSCVEYSFWFNSHASKNACAIHKIQTFEQPFLKLYFINTVRMNCSWLFLGLPWHLVCARAVWQLGTDSKIPSAKPSTEKFQLNYRVFPPMTQSSAATDQSQIQGESDVKHCATKWLSGFVKNLDFVCGYFPFSISRCELWVS